jgi:hypothetical protein
VLGPLVYFTAGTQTIRIQQREDGVSLDQIVLSPTLYSTAAPGATKQDAVILPLTAPPAPAPPATPPPPPAPAPSTTEIVILASSATALAGNWTMIADPTAANGKAVGTADAGAAKVASAAASPVNYVEFTFQAEAGKTYHLWIRGRAEKDSWANDSAFVQFSGAIDAAGAPLARIGSTAAFGVNLEDDANAGVSGWGWQDNGYGAGVMGPAIRFQSTGTQTIRLQTREDGFRLDQIVLSAQTYLNSSPGSLKDDSTILR